MTNNVVHIGARGQLAPVRDAMDPLVPADPNIAQLGHRGEPPYYIQTSRGAFWFDAAFLQAWERGQVDLVSTDRAAAAWLLTCNRRRQGLPPFARAFCAEEG